MGQRNSHAVLQENTIISKTKQLNISEEDLQRLQQRVCEEYPFIATVYESVVVTDITLYVRFLCALNSYSRFMLDRITRSYFATTTSNA